MKMREISPDLLTEANYNLSDLDKQFDFDIEKDEFGKKLEYSSNLFVRGIKKITSSIFWSAVAGAAGSLVGPLGTIGGVAVGAILGWSNAGKKPASTELQDLAQEPRILDNFYENYISVDAIKSLNLDEINTKIAVDTAELKYNSKKEILLLSELPEMKVITKHLYMAARELSDIAEKNDIQDHTEVSKLFEYFYDNSPIDEFFKNLKQIL